MERTTRFLLVKFILTFIFAFVALFAIRGNNLYWVGFVAVAVTVLNYLAGDILILPAFGNAVATVADGLSAMLVAHMAGVMVRGFRTGLFPLLLFGLMVATGEFFLHRYLQRRKDAAI